MIPYILFFSLAAIIVLLLVINKDADSKRNKQLETLYKKSVELQRNGKLKEYGEVMSEIEKIEETL
jgi:hypothetical protein